MVIKPCNHENINGYDYRMGLSRDFIKQYDVTSENVRKSVKRMSIPMFVLKLLLIICLLIALLITFISIEAAVSVLLPISALIAPLIIYETKHCHQVYCIGTKNNLLTIVAPIAAVSDSGTSFLTCNEMIVQNIKEIRKVRAYRSGGYKIVITGGIIAEKLVYPGTSTKDTGRSQLDQLGEVLFIVPNAQVCDYVYSFYNRKKRGGKG